MKGAAGRVSAHMRRLMQTKKQRKLFVRILAAGMTLIAAAVAPLTGLWRLAAFLVPYFIVGWPVLVKAGKNISHGQVFDENFLMSIATIGALILSEYAEAVGVMLFYQVGELFQSCAVERSRRSIAGLMDIRPDTADLIRDGEVIETDAQDISPGNLIRVRPGGRIALDGRIVEGTTSLDTSALTGESLPRAAGPGDEVMSGCVNLSGLITIEVTKSFGESTASRILALVESAGEAKARSEAFITRFARYYTPAVVIGAVVLALVPPLFTGSLTEWVRRALTFLVISCPCAVVISVPLAFFGGIGGASRQGILVKGGNFLELLAQTDTVVFDKTGTLTQGDFTLTSVRPADSVTENELLTLAALAERGSGHPIALSICRNAQIPNDNISVTDVREEPGLGVEAVIDGRVVLAGNDRLLRKHGVVFPALSANGGTVLLARDGKYIGYCEVADTAKPTAKDTVSALKGRGVQTVMLTGDGTGAAGAVADTLGIDRVYARLLPADKVERVEQLMAENAERGTLVYVGDGINDAPVLTRADVGIAMGALGSDAAIEAADIVLMDDDPMRLITAMDLSRKCRRIVRENIVFSLGVKGVFLVLGALGATNMWGAVFADVGVAALAILNSIRMLSVKKR